MCACTCMYKPEDILLTLEPTILARLDARSPQDLLPPPTVLGHRPVFPLWALSISAGHRASVLAHSLSVWPTKSSPNS